MNELLLNTWHCDNPECEKTFYTILEEEPHNCPFCGDVELSDSMILTTRPLTPFLKR